jgi:hypothetical protein
MTTQEAENFVNTELKGLWPDWTPTDAEIRLWLRELEKADYFPTRANIQNWFIQQTYPGKRPIIGKVRHLFCRILTKQQREEQTEPVLLYTIVKESNIKQKQIRDFKTGEYTSVEYTSMPGQNFCLGNRSKLPADPEIIEQEAEQNRQRFNEIYGGNHIVIRHWEKLYDFS